MKLLFPLLLVACLRSEAQAPARSFEVAAIKFSNWPSQSYFEGFAAGAGNCGRQNPKIDGARVTLTRTTTCGLIRIAYGLQPYQVLEAPQWMTERKPDLYFDIQAQAAEDLASAEDAQEMLRALLADRFGLRFHRETS